MFNSRYQGTGRHKMKTMNIYFFDPTFIAPNLFKYVLEVLKVQYIYSFLQKEEMDSQILDDMTPMLQGIYNGKNLKPLVNSCLYRIVKQIKENVTTISKEDFKKLSIEDKKKYSTKSIRWNIENFGNINIAILVHSSPRMNLKGVHISPYSVPQIEENLRTYSLHEYITQECLSALNKKGGKEDYSDQVAFAISDYLMISFFVYSHVWIDTTPDIDPPEDYYNYMLYEQQMMNMKPQGYYEWEWSKQYIHLANGKYVGFSFFINYTIFKKHPTEYPIIEKNGKKCYQGILTSEDNAKKEDFWEELKRLEENCTPSYYDTDD